MTTQQLHNTTEVYNFHFRCVVKLVCSYGGPYVPTFSQSATTQQQKIHNEDTTTATQPQHNTLNIVVLLLCCDPQHNGSGNVGLI